MVKTVENTVEKEGKIKGIWKSVKEYAKYKPMSEGNKGAIAFMSICSSPFLLVLGFAIFAGHQDSKNNEIRQQYLEHYETMIGLIDENNDNHITHKEWAKAYNQIGKRYNERDPSYLSYEDLGDIIKVYSKENRK